MQENEHGLRCSFCGKTQNQVKRLISGPNVCICNECVDLCQEIMDNEKVEGENDLELELKKPAEIKSILDSYVIQQEKAKKALAVAVYNHYKRITSKIKRDTDIELQKSNILMVGPTGSGKTLLAQTLARTLNVPFAIADATTLTEAGYVGEDVENIILKLIQAADYDIEKAETGIIYIDEIIDKKAQKKDILTKVQTEDLLKFGLIPELIGRLPVTVTLEELDEDAMIEILTKPKNALVKQYKELLKFDNVELEFDRSALEYIAKKAIEKKAGARGLRGIIESTIMDIMYEIPSREDVEKIIITRESVEDNKLPKLILKNK